MLDVSLRADRTASKERIMPEQPPPGSPRRRFERAFMLRVWRESGNKEAATLRGSLVELGNERRFFFTHLKDLKDFLRLTLEEADE
jgi:hypothetical protein